MASLCVELRMSPGEYWNLRSDEFAALVKELKLRHKEQEKAAQGG